MNAQTWNAQQLADYPDRVAPHLDLPHAPALAQIEREFAMLRRIAKVQAEGRALSGATMERYVDAWMRQPPHHRNGSPVDRDAAAWRAIRAILEGGE